MLRPIIIGVILPIIAGLIITLTGANLRAGVRGWLARIGWEGAALLIFYAVLHVALLGWFGFPPHDVKLWPPFLALAAVPLTVTFPVRWLRALLAVLVVAGATTLLVMPNMTYKWSPGVAVLWLAVIIIGWLCTIAGWQRAAAAATPGAALAALVVAAGASALSISLFGTFTYAQLVGLIAFPTAVVGMMAWWRGSSSAAATSLALALSVLLPMWWILAATGAGLPPWAPILLALSGAASAGAGLPWLRAAAPWKRIVCIAVAATVPVAPVLVWGMVQSMRMSANADGY